MSSFSAGWALAQESIAGGSQGLTGLLQEKIKQDLDEAQKIRDQLAKAEYEPVLRRDFSSNNPDARRRVNQYFQLQHLQKRQQELEARIERYSKLPLELESARNTLALIQSGGDFSPAQATRMWATRTPALSPDERMAESEAAARGETKGTLRGMAEMGVPPAFAYGSALSALFGGRGEQEVSPYDRAYMTALGTAQGEQDVATSRMPQSTALMGPVFGGVFSNAFVGGLMKPDEWSDRLNAADDNVVNRRASRLQAMELEEGKSSVLSLPAANQAPRVALSTSRAIIAPIHDACAITPPPAWPP